MRGALVIRGLPRDLERSAGKARRASGWRVACVGMAGGSVRDDGVAWAVTANVVIPGLPRDLERSAGKARRASGWRVARAGMTGWRVLTANVVIPGLPRDLEPGRWEGRGRSPG